MADSAYGPSKGCEVERSGKKKAKITHTCGKRENNDRHKRINLNDFRESKRESQAKLVYEIGYILRNKCPMVEWMSWKKVLDDLKKSMLDDLAISGS
ncbi:delta(7)-sterol-C5(6)-desaturase-like [Pyrus ussuriensis x Pyrus communis]|uniref:Delta(7)-sterol-C5(6)-desaturase-like n=1 Tax=Pyrus ussuriensis x Pyrus communis TaxID=2448454 RepID=A0A5N5FSK0_9ROSA|nr:delta(7)-sterol-C5(6)-desaturase-like [Pyrus ussuriensis x Pyrus communis]